MEKRRAHKTRFKMVLANWNSWKWDGESCRSQQLFLSEAGRRLSQLDNWLTNAIVQL